MAGKVLSLAWNRWGSTLDLSSNMLLISVLVIVSESDAMLNMCCANYYACVFGLSASWA